MYLEFTEPWATTRHDSMCVCLCGWKGVCVCLCAPILSHSGQPGRRVTFSDQTLMTEGLYIIKHNFLGHDLIYRYSVNSG